MTSPRVSVVIPFFNESEVAGAVVDEVVSVLARLEWPSELILVDDGSTDGTADVLLRPCSMVHRRVLRLKRNSGQAAALWQGLHACRGDIVVTLDGDGQNDPNDIPSLLDRLQRGDCDMVVGVRANRQDSALRRSMSRVANAVRGRWLGDGVSDTGCALKAFRREVIEAFLPVRTLYSFIPAFAAGRGFRVVEQPVAHRPRRAGQSKYGLAVMLWRPFVDMLAIGWVLKRVIPAVAAEELADRSDVKGTPPSS